MSGGWTPGERCEKKLGKSACALGLRNWTILLKELSSCYWEENCEENQMLLGKAVFWPTVIPALCFQIYFSQPVSSSDAFILCRVNFCEKQTLSWPIYLQETSLKISDLMWLWHTSRSRAFCFECGCLHETWNKKTFIYAQFVQFMHHK